MIGNAWNRLRYTLWSPAYDLVGRRFDPLRRRSIGQLGLVAGQRVLLVGAGTGADLPYLPASLRVLATDLTPSMLARARDRARGVHLAIMDAHRLAVPDGAFDAVILHLIVAVVPDPVACLREAARALRPGGRLSVLDKFLAEGASPSLPRRVANLVTRLLFTDINRRFGDVLAAARVPLVVESDEPAALGGFFRLLLLKRPA